MNFGIVADDVEKTPRSFVTSERASLEDLRNNKLRQRSVLKFCWEFDYIHARDLTGYIKDWPNLMGNVYNQTSSGGYVEFEDWDLEVYSADGTVTHDHDLYKCHLKLRNARESQGSSKRSDVGYDMRPGMLLKSWLEDTGFEDVVEQVFEVPIGP